MEMVKVRRMKARIRAKDEEDEQRADRLSDLPDSLIHYILSFIDAKYAVQTSVLSTRWLHLWTSLPHLNFHCDSFRSLNGFTQFVSRFMFHRDGGSNISTLRFVYPFTVFVKSSLLKEVVVYALSHNVQELDIRFFNRRDLRLLPLIAKNCPSLKKYKLSFPRYFGIMRFTKFFHLPAMTTLHLCNIFFTEVGSRSLELFSKCVNLKNLTLTGCSTDCLEVFNIFSPQLENLTISWHVNIFSRREYIFSRRESVLDIITTVCRLVISAPKLNFLHLDGFPHLELSVYNLSCLEKLELRADIRYDSGHRWTSEEKQMAAHITHLRLHKALQELRNAKCFTLFWNLIEVLSIVPDLLKYQPSPFDDTKTLKLKHWEFNKSAVPDHVMTYLLNFFPNATVMEFY